MMNPAEPEHSSSIPPVPMVPPNPNGLLLSDLQNLEHLAIAWKIFAVLMALFGFCPSVHIFIGFTVLIGSGVGAQAGIPTFIGGLFLFVGLFVMALMWTLAGLMWYTAKLLQEQRRWTFALVMACVACSNFPLGTALGVLTIIVIVRPQVKAAFLRNTMPASGA